MYGSKAFSQGFQEMRGGGLRSMWQGNAVNVLKGTPQSTLQCLIYAQVRLSIELLVYSLFFFRLISTLRCPLLRLDEGLHPKQDPADSDSAAAFRVGLHLWSCGSRCLLPLRGQISGRSEYFNISVLKCRSLTVLIVTLSLLDSL